jgi:DNA-binding NarL/FixJ family response regulator
MPISVAVVEDHADYRMGMDLILRSSPSCMCVGQFARAEDLMDVFDELHPDVVLMDIGLPGISGIEATSTLKERYPHTEVIILTVFEDNDSVFRAICAGASGYITKPVMPQALIEAIDQAFNGGTPMSPHIARRVIELFRQHVPPPKADYQLTPREVEVLTYLTQGYDYKQIAEKLFVSLFTVNAHIRHIYEKLHVHSKSQAVAKALKEGMVPPR